MRQLHPYSNQTLKMDLGMVFVVSLALGLSGCFIASRPLDEHRKNSNLTHGVVQTQIHVGQTTQTQILETFGAPNITTIDGSGQEVWTYQRAATATQSSTGGNYWTIIFAGGARSSSGFESSSRMTTLIIKFNSDKVVSDFKSRTSNF